VNFYMENFEEGALCLAPHKPLCWFWYISSGRSKITWD
jgi:hypothetical protein